MMPLEFGIRNVEDWIADLDDAGWDRLSVCLSGEEQSRVGRFRVPLAGERYRRGRSLLRNLLAGYLDMPPDRIAFKVGAFGKPEIAKHPIQFNLSHSRNMAVVAFASAPIGVDVEFVDPERDFRTLVPHVCNSREAERLSALPEGEAIRRFYSTWTGKEAYLKAIGLGLQHPLGGIDIVQGPSSRGRDVIDANAVDDRAYRVFDVSVGGGYECHLCLDVEPAGIVVRPAVIQATTPRPSSR